MRELQQLFADFNFKQTSISPTMAMARDSSDIYIEATRRLASGEVVRTHGGMETKSASLGAKSTALVVLQNLVRFVRGAAEGDRFTEAKTNIDMDDDDRRLKEENVDQFVARVGQFLTGMAEVMGTDRFAKTRNSVHLSGPGWGALGVVFYDLDKTLGVGDVHSAGRKLGEIDWQRVAPFWSDIMREKEVRGRKTLTFVGGGYETRQSIRRKAHEHLKTGGFAIVVVQDSYYKNIHNDLPTILSEMATSKRLILLRQEVYRQSRSMSGLNPHTRRYRSGSETIEVVLCFVKSE